MDILRTKNDLRLWRKNLAHKRIGFAPTMGALHDGHLSLFRASKHDNEKTIASIFVNPAQFGVNEDFDKYPRSEAQDLELCEKNGVDAVFLPTIAEMYDSGNETNIIPPKNLANAFEGGLRAGHFNGVLRVVMKFFNLIRPNCAYFGQKDAQQLLIIKKMVSDLFMPINIVPCEIVRDKNGLALSSRNKYLNANSYQNALKIPSAINAVRVAYENGECDSKVLENIALSHIESLTIDYCKIVDFNLHKAKKALRNATILLLAVRVAVPSAHRAGQISEVRLLDNIWF
ncbi:pantoate--beta-alanine ligase [Helicobacter sp. 23-1044]